MGANTEYLAAEISDYFETVFVSLPPTKQNQTLHYQLLGEAQRRGSVLLKELGDPKAALSVIQEEYSSGMIVKQAEIFEKGQLWTPEEQQKNTRRGAYTTLAALALFFVGFLVLIYGLTFGRSQSALLWVGITILLWVPPAVFLYARFALAKEEEELQDELEQAQQQQNREDFLEEQRKK